MSASDPAGLSVVVMGLGSFGGGAGAARFLARRGARVLVTDLRGEAQLAESLASLEGLGIETALGGHRVEDFEAADWVVANPAVRPDHPLLARARAHGARIVTEVALALEHVPARWVAVTGTQGKSSTCRMTADLLRAAGLRATAGGNLGGSLLDHVEELGPEDVCVVELSSYQLEYVEPAAGGARAVALLNVLPDHLDRHGSLAGYARSKLRLLELLAPGGTSFLPLDLPVEPPLPRAGERRCLHAARPDPRAGLLLADGLFRLGDLVLGRAADLSLPRFQLGNALVALGLAHACGASPERLAGAVRGLTAPEHRLQDLGRFAGRRVFDNGVSTTPDSTASALEDVPDPPCVLILGGRSKGLDLAPLLTAARGRVAAAVVFGEAAAELRRALETADVRTLEGGTLEGAVRRAFAEAPPGRPVLFSPACSSFDAFQNFRARAQAFRSVLPRADALTPGA